ncbi:unnamed protein product [Effrenium voratum]|uniref:Mei2-like C-terminal RNA recognition motif domain-containing protein n=1 Tax=Effrenium voratum TaxID=2562239 RepID=A0AA36NIM8_9DINO|nr:unnamed protein product [Effrenium voratum]
MEPTTLPMSCTEGCDKVVIKKTFIELEGDATPTSLPASYNSDSVIWARFQREVSPEETPEEMPEESQDADASSLASDDFDNPRDQPHMTTLDEKERASQHSISTTASDTDTPREGMLPRLDFSSEALDAAQARAVSAASEALEAAGIASDRQALDQLLSQMTSAPRPVELLPALQPCGKQGQTTVMLRNLPNNYSRAMVCVLMDKEGFAGKYDFLYLPIDFRSKASLGYAFVNLVDENEVQKFWQCFDGFTKWVLPSAKVCSVSWSGPHQGQEAHVERYRDSPIMHSSVPDEFKPVIFQAGTGLRVDFPPPKKKLRAKVELDPRAARAPHLITTAPPVEYEVVVPTYRRWLSTQEVTRKKRFQTSSRPFILEHTLAFLSREGVPKQKVTLFVANEEEEQEYRKAIQESEWAEVRIQVSLPGIRDSRNFIYKFFPAGTYVVSLDDDMEGIQWKIREGSKISACMELLPPGAFIKIIYDAYQRMQDVGGYLWGLSTCQNPHFISLDDVSTRNGLVNGYLHGFICRPDAAHDLLRRLPDAVEDAEFSVRHFAKDRVVLRYRMYAGMTSPYSNGGGLQSKFNARAGDVRKTEEWYGAQQLHQLFPTLIAAPSNGDSQRYHATEVRFISQTGDGIKSRRAAVRRFQGLCRFVLPQLKGNKKKSDRGKSALAKVKAFAMKKPMQPAQSSSKRMLHGKSGEVAKVEGPLALLPEVPPPGWIHSESSPAKLWSQAFGPSRVFLARTSYALWQILSSGARRRTADMQSTAVRRR